MFGCGQNRSIISPINQAPPKAQYRAGPPRAHRPASAGRDVRQQGLTTWHCCWDNAVAESFFATYKKELIHTRPWPTIDQLKTATFSWIETYYNRARRHSTLNYLTPLEYELGYRDIHELAA